MQMKESPGGDHGLFPDGGGLEKISRNTDNALINDTFVHCAARADLIETPDPQALESFIWSRRFSGRPLNFPRIWTLPSCWTKKMNG